MPINLPPQLRFDPPRTSGAVDLSFLKGAQAKMSLENLNETRDIRESGLAAAEAAKTKTPQTMTQDGFTVNVGNSEEIDPDIQAKEYINNLRKRGRVELADKFEKAHGEYTQEKELREIDSTLRAFDLVEAGYAEKGINDLNKVLPKKEQVKGISVNVDPKTGLRSADISFANGRTAKIKDVDSMRKAAVDQKTKYLNTYDQPVFNEKDGYISQRNPNTGKVEVLVKFDSKNLTNSKEDRENQKELWHSYLAHPYVQTFNSIRQARLDAVELVKQNNSAADAALVYKVARVWDPQGRTVTDQDFTNVEKARPLIERMGLSVEQYKTLLAGGTLTAETRGKLLGTLDMHYKVQKDLIDNLVNPQWDQRRKAMGLSKDLFDPSVLRGMDFDVETTAKQAYGKYEPDKYEYKIDPENPSRIGRKLKGAK